ncbi:hypothetical protein CCP3SC1AL1_1490006 [Gammaproteobacteria bacterium]
MELSSPLPLYENYLVSKLKTLKIDELSTTLLRDKLLNDIYHIHKDTLLLNIIKRDFPYEIVRGANIGAKVVELYKKKGINIVNQYPVLFYSIKTFGYRKDLHIITLLKTMTVADINTVTTTHKHIRNIFRVNRDNILREVLRKEFSINKSVIGSKNIEMLFISEFYNKYNQHVSIKYPTLLSEDLHSVTPKRESPLDKELSVKRKRYNDSVNDLGDGGGSPINKRFKNNEIDYSIYDNMEFNS